jgi:hypothetical protein
LESHHRESDHLWVELVKQPADRFSHATKAKDQISNSNVVVIVYISRKRGQSAIGHADGYRRHVLEVVGHGE